MHNQDTPKGLEHLSTYEPKPALWDNIEAQLDKEENKKIVYWRWARGLAASIVLIMVIQFFIGKNDDLAELNKQRLAEAAMESRLENQNMPVVTVPKSNQNTPKTALTIDTSALKPENTNSSSGDTAQLFVTLDSITLSDNWALSYTVGNTSTISEVEAFSYSNSATAGASYSSEPGGKTFTIPSSGEKYQMTLNANSSMGATDNSNHLNQGTVSYNWQAKPTSNSNHISNGEMYYDFNNQSSHYHQDLDVEEGVDMDEDGVAGFWDKDWSFGDGDVKNDANVKSHSYDKSGLYRVYTEPVNTESYYPLIENEYENPLEEPLSTFGIDVDNASYSVMRTKLRSNYIVPKDAVRVEEFINYFDYEYPQPMANRPFSVNLENASCPWNTTHQLVPIGLNVKHIDYNDVQHSNLVFLIDVCGSLAM
jgi:hypothetical protein